MWFRRPCENPRDGGVWWAAVYGVAQSRTWLKQLSNIATATAHHTHTSTREYTGTLVTQNMACSAGTVQPVCFVTLSFRSLGCSSPYSCLIFLKQKSTEAKGSEGLECVTNPIQRRQWHPTPVLLPGKSHGRRSLVGCSPWGREELDTTEQLHFHSSLSCTGEGNGNPLQCSCLENPRDGGPRRAAVYGVTQSRTRLKRLSSSGNQPHCRSLCCCCSVAQPCLPVCNPMTAARLPCPSPSPKVCSNSCPWFRFCYQPLCRSLCTCVKLLQSCLTLCDPMDCIVACQAPLSLGFSRQEYWSGLPCLLCRSLLWTKNENFSCESTGKSRKILTCKSFSNRKNAIKSYRMK